MRLSTALILSLGSLTCDPGTGPAADGTCGNAVIDPDEACDDGNSVDGDGCSAACELEYPAPSCVSLIETSDALPGEVLITSDGRLLVTGQLVRSDGIPRAWVGAFNLDGQTQWSIDLDDKFGAGAITQTQGGFAFTATALNAPTDIVTIDDSGDVLGTYTLLDDDPNVGAPAALLDDGAGLLLGGTRDSDLWLARLGDDGQLTTLVHHDHAGLYDSFSHLRHHHNDTDDTIVALARVGTVSLSDGDNVAFDTIDTWFVEYDPQGQELRRTVLTSGEDHISIGVNDIDVAADGTWLLAGQMFGTNYKDPGGLGWAAAVRDGELLWTFEAAAEVERSRVLPLSSFAAAALSTDVLLGGQTVSTQGVRRWALRLDLESGAWLDDSVGAPVQVGPDLYHGGAAFGGQALLVGSTRGQDGVEQWLCVTPI